MVGSRERTTRHSPINTGDGAIEQSILKKLVELDRSTSAALEQSYGATTAGRIVVGALGVAGASAIPTDNLSATSLAGEPQPCIKIPPELPPPLDDSSSSPPQVGEPSALVSSQLYAA